MKVERRPEPLNAAKHAKDKTQIRVAIGGSYADRGRGSRNKALWPEPSRMTAAIKKVVTAAGQTLDIEPRLEYFKPRWRQDQTGSKHPRPGRAQSTLAHVMVQEYENMAGPGVKLWAARGLAKTWHPPPTVAAPRRDQGLREPAPDRASRGGPGRTK